MYHRVWNPSDIDEKVTGSGFDIIVDATGSIDAVQHALKFLRKGGQFA